MYLTFSGSQATQGGKTTPPEDHFQHRADASPGGGVPSERVHLQESSLRAGRNAAPDRNANQDLVPESQGQGQTH